MGLRFHILLGLFSALSPIFFFPTSAKATDRPNILFISIDDLNDWVGCMGGHPQALTPNLDRLAASGVLFTNAHCPAPACNPSRGAIFTGVSPHISGLYDNRQSMRDRMPKVELLPRCLSRQGYWSAGSGKLLHYIIDAPSWDEYFPPKATEDPFPRTYYPKQRPVNLPVGGSWQYVETDWAALDISDEEFGGDWLVSRWIGEQLSRKQERPFFLACGIYRPHEPWFVPRSYFEPFPIESIQLPPGYREDDLDDLPPAGKKRGPNRYFEHIREEGQWKQAIQGYLASIYFADTMLGRVLNALEQGPSKDNTIVVLWSDHGWHLGEKQHWLKFTGWRVCTRVPFIIRAPLGTPGLPQGTATGTRCDAPVNLLSLFPTLIELAGLPAVQGNSGPSLLPLLKDDQARWPHASLTYLGRPGNLAVSGKRYRYIAYDNGDEELYDIQNDPHEWTNLAAVPEHAAALTELRKHIPNEFAKYEGTRADELPTLDWFSSSDEREVDANVRDAQASHSTAEKFRILISNKTGQPLKVFWRTREGLLQSQGTLETGWSKPYETYANTVWVIQDSSGRQLGYFQTGTSAAHATIPDEVR